MIGRIYRIIHMESDLCYIGSTSGELRFRWQSHRTSYLRWLSGATNNCSIYQYFKNHGIDKFRMILIKEYEVEDRKHLQAYEQLWINKFRKPAIIKNDAFDGKAIFRKEINQQYYRENKEKIKARANERTKQRTKEERDRALAYSKQYYRENKAKYRAYASVSHDCGCGGRYSGGGKSNHVMSKKHIKWMTEQDQ
ncbi:unnamed protein product [Phytophthora fragariaefolia]|uniref:Unnamed protein product n=1 Tax=Phytophthora fragariaefolia TaxID=1490495 RepID=A0A9W6Y7I6_9STRA|nr:unnamed protein product [Phytophthora fragariaefolia]